MSLFYSSKTCSVNVVKNTPTIQPLSQCNCTLIFSRGFSGASSTSLLSHTQQYAQQHCQSYPRQQYAPSNQALVHPVYNEPSPDVVPHGFSIYQPALHTAPELAETVDYSASTHAPHNYPYVTHSNSYYHSPISIYSHSSSVANYQLSPEAVFPTSSGQYSVSVPDPSNCQFNHYTSIPGPIREHSTKSNYRSQQPYYNASLSNYDQKTRAIYHNQNQKFTPDNRHKNKFGPLKNYCSKKEKYKKPQEIFKVTANFSEDSDQTRLTKKIPVYENTCIYKPFNQNSNHQSCRPSTKTTGREIQAEENSSDNKLDDELWNWEYDAIFKDPPSAEIVTLAQPLAAGFKSTPVPLVQTWSPSLPSVSRYARKDNEKEFVRSIRCSPQWSYMQEDPAFIDARLDGPLVSLEKVPVWASARRDVGLYFSEKHEKNLASNCTKRETSGGFECENEHKYDIKIRDEFGGDLERPPAKKLKSASFGDQNE